MVQETDGIGACEIRLCSPPPTALQTDATQEEQHTASPLLESQGPCDTGEAPGDLLSPGGECCSLTQALHHCSLHILPHPLGPGPPTQWSGPRPPAAFLDSERRTAALCANVKLSGRSPSWTCVGLPSTPFEGADHRPSAKVRLQRGPDNNVR